MGGNALKNCVTRRYDAKEYFELEAEVLAKLRADFPGRKVSAVQAYRNKPSFGDADVLMSSDNLHVELIPYLKTNFQSKEIVRNSNVYSFEYKEFQVDLILMPEKFYETSRQYYSWNDTSNFLGRIAYRLGTALTHEGLKLTYRDGAYQFAELIVSQDWDKILSFLGYNPVRYNQGFDNLEDMYQFAASSPFFNKSIFALENRNATSRVRDKKRANYRGFLEWMEKTPNLPEYPWENLSERGGREVSEKSLKRLFQFFPEFEVEHDKTMADFAIWKEAKTLFNGDVVSAWTGLTTLDLGKLMKHLKETGAEFKPSFREWIIANKDNLQTWVMAEKAKMFLD